LIATHCPIHAGGITGNRSTIILDTLISVRALTGLAASETDPLLATNFALGARRHLVDEAIAVVVFAVTDLF